MIPHLYLNGYQLTFSIDSVLSTATGDTKEVCSMGVLLIKGTAFSGLVLAEQFLRKLSRFCSCSYQWVERHWKLFRLRHKGEYSCWWKATYVKMPQNLFFFQPTHCYPSASELFCMQMKPVWAILVSCFPDKWYRNRHPWKVAQLGWTAESPISFKNSILGHLMGTNKFRISGSGTWRSVIIFK